MKRFFKFFFQIYVWVFIFFGLLETCFSHNINEQFKLAINHDYIFTKVSEFKKINKYNIKQIRIFNWCYNQKNRLSYKRFIYVVQLEDILFYVSWITGIIQLRLATIDNYIDDTNRLKIGKKFELYNYSKIFFTFFDKYFNKFIFFDFIKNYKLKLNGYLFFLKKENHFNYNKYICKNKLKEKIFLVGNGENLLEKDKIISKVDTSKIFSPIYYLNISNKIKKNSWYWPTTGKIIDSYSNSEGGNKGIDISGMFNQPIVATRNGVVMYVGNLLQGYGNLIIIRHSNEYLSAYAHNNKILVFEKQKVMAGEKIATMGNSGTNLVKLHFEIRYKGKSVDPLRYLPSLGLKS